MREKLSAFVKDKDSGLLFLTLIFPALLLLPLESMTAGDAFVPLSCILGLIIGVLLILTVGGSFRTYWQDRILLKYITLLSPLVLFLSFTNETFRSCNFFCIYFLALGVLGYFAFVQPISDRAKRISVTVILAACLFAIEFCLFTTEQFSPDSMAYYEISKNIFTDFGKINTARQYIHPSEYDVSFPYLYPLMIAVVNLFTGLEIYSGIVVNLIAVCLTCLMLYKLALRYFNNPYIGAIAAVFLCANPPYLGEVMAARAVPTAILCTVSCLYFLLSLPRISTKGAFLAGFAAGAGMVIRFDGMVFAACAAGAVFLFARGKRIKSLLLFLVGMLIPMLPWIIYSLAVFGSPWITDNGGTAFLLMPTIPQRYCSEGYVAKTLFNNKDAWFNYYSSYKLPAVWKGFYNCAICGGAVCMILWMIVIFIRTVGHKIKGFFSANKKLFIVVGLGLVYCIGKFLALSIVGFGDDRYHTEVWLLLVMSISAIFSAMHAYESKGEPEQEASEETSFEDEIAQAENPEIISHCNINKLRNDKFFGACVCVLAIAVMGRYAISPYVLQKYPDMKTKFRNYYVKSKYQQTLLTEKGLYGAAELRQLGDIIKSYGNPEPRVLFASNPYDSATYRFGAYTGIATFSYPVIYNDDANGLYELVDNYIKPDYVVVTNNDCSKLLERYGLQQTTEYSGYKVYKVTNRSTYTTEGVQ